jgi:hypothetical protein
MLETAHSIHKKNMNREETLSKLLDEMIILFCLNDNNMDYVSVDLALRQIAQSRRGNPRYPITVSLYDYMKINGYLRDGE